MMKLRYRFELQYFNQNKVFLKKWTCFIRRDELRSFNQSHKIIQMIIFIMQLENW